VSVITTFLQSEQALKFLGLPGLALLLAFVFYRTMVANRLVRPISRNQSFIVLVLIIVYFSVVSVLLIWVFRPERAAQPPASAAAGPAPGKIEEPSVWTKIDGFFDQARIDTPLETFDSKFGPATADSAIDPETSKLRKRTYFTGKGDVLVTVGHDDRSVQWIAAFDQAQKLRIPTLNFGLGQDDGSVRRYNRLSDFDLQSVAEFCAKIEMPGRGGTYAATPCYFGRPGGYNYFAFIFMTSRNQPPFEGNCSPLALASGALSAERVGQCPDRREKPLGFIVASSEELLPKAVETFIDTLEN
jgi:hypothetical protein